MYKLDSNSPKNACNRKGEKLKFKLFHESRKDKPKKITITLEDVRILRFGLSFCIAEGWRHLDRDRDNVYIKKEISDAQRLMNSLNSIARLEASIVEVKKCT